MKNKMNVSEFVADWTTKNKPYGHSYDNSELEKLIRDYSNRPFMPEPVDELIGKKCKGFEFKDGEFGRLVFAGGMKECIGQVGIIKTYNSSLDSYRVYFNSYTDWSYPASRVKQNLV